MKKFDYDKLKGKIREYWKTQSAYANWLGISEASLYEKFNSDSYFNQNQIVRTLEFINADFVEAYELFFKEKVELNSTI